MEQTVRKINVQVDVLYSQGRWYLHKWSNDECNSINSVSRQDWRTKEEALRAYHVSAVDWQERKVTKMKRLIKSFEATSYEQLARWDHYRKEYGFATFGDFARTALENFCHALEGDKLAWPKPTSRVLSAMTEAEIELLAEEYEFDCQEANDDTL